MYSFCLEPTLYHSAQALGVPYPHWIYVSGGIFLTDFYDSARPGLIPAGAHACLYYDGAFVPNEAEVKRLGPVRWITVLGGAAVAAHTGACDYESGNAIHDDPALLREWAVARKAMNCRARLYCDRSDAAAAMAQVHDLENVRWWIATLDDKRWTAEDLLADLSRNHGVTIPAERLWANQFAGGVTAAYDTSQLYPGQAW